MSSLVLMRILESAPDRYDAGMQALTLGGWRRAQAAVAREAVPTPGARVLEIGCGTGALTEQLIARGARVVAIDQNPQMLDQARLRLAEVPSEFAVLEERTAAEIDGFEEEAFDGVASSYVFSELSSSERAYVLRQVSRLLRPAGVLAIADEVVPRSPLKRLLHRALRAPLALLTWIVTGRTSRPLADLAGEIRSAGLELRGEHRSALGTTAVIVAERRK